jgi:hypothetical protein
MAKAVIVGESRHLTRSVKNSGFFRSKINYKGRNVKINHTLPFKVKFINIGIQPYGVGNAAPIGIAVIGRNNYVM